HGKSIILSTHLLADVQAVCEHAVILAAGRVLGHGPVAELCQVRNDRYRLRLQGEASAFRTDLEAAGVAFLPATAAGDWRVSRPAGPTTPSSNWPRRMAPRSARWCATMKRWKSFS